MIGVLGLGLSAPSPSLGGLPRTTCHSLQAWIKSTILNFGSGMNGLTSQSDWESKPVDQTLRAGRGVCGFAKPGESAERYPPPAAIAIAAAACETGVCVCV